MLTALIPLPTPTHPVPAVRIAHLPPSGAGPNGRQKLEHDQTGFISEPRTTQRQGTYPSLCAISARASQASRASQHGLRRLRASLCGRHMRHPPHKTGNGEQDGQLSSVFQVYIFIESQRRFSEATPAAALVGRVRTAGTWGLVDFLLDPSHPSHPLLCTPPPMPCTLVPGAASLQSRSTAHGIAERDDRAQCPSRESAGASGLAPRRPSVAYDSGHGLPPRISITSLPSPRRSRLSIPRHRLLIPQTIAFVWRGLVDTQTTSFLCLIPHLHPEPASFPLLTELPHTHNTNL